MTILFNTVKLLNGGLKGIKAIEEWRLLVAYFLFSFPAFPFPSPSPFPVSSILLKSIIKQDPFFREGLERGKKEGLKEGVEKGIEKGKKEIVQKIYQKGILSPEEIADLLELPLEFVKEAIAELQKRKEEK